jgi:hypothetical protein
MEQKKITCILQPCPFQYPIKELPMNTTSNHIDLNRARAHFQQRRFLNTPLAGLLCWLCIGIGGSVIEAPQAKALLVFILTGSIVYIAMLLSKITGEPFFHKIKNPFDNLFLLTVLMAFLVYSIAIPFYLQDYRSLPLSVGILTGLMWLPFSWIIAHWVGIFHTFIRTALILLAWFIAPEQSYVLVPAIIVIIYLITIAVLELRWRALPSSADETAAPTPTAGNE